VGSGVGRWVGPGVGRWVGSGVGRAVGAMVGRTVGNGGSTIVAGGGVGGCGVALGTIRAISRGTGGFGGTRRRRGCGRAGTGAATTRGRTTGTGVGTTGGGLTGGGVSTVICVSATSDSGEPPSTIACSTKITSATNAIAWMRIERRYATANRRRSPGMRRTRQSTVRAGRWPFQLHARRAFAQAAVSRNFVPNAGPSLHSSQVGTTCFHV
jgi:hypothetical protein